MSNLQEYKLNLKRFKGKKKNNEKMLSNAKLRCTGIKYTIPPHVSKNHTEYRTPAYNSSHFNTALRLLQI